ncbi:RNA polymerase sigma factor (sigma-70 family) [Clostridiales Family XIII bacterium PM5-7]
MKERLKKYTTLEELYLDNYKLVFSYLLDYDLKDTYLQEELASIIWFKIWERHDSILEKEKKWVKNYLRIVAKTTVIDHLRKVKKESIEIKKMGELIEPLNPWSSVEKEVTDQEMRQYLYQCLNMLSDEEKMLITLRFYLEFSAKETGEHLFISEGNVRVRQLRIITKLRKELNKLMKEKE